jgi:6-phosphogluconolactonase (cycloisomerase 2 family)
MNDRLIAFAHHNGYDDSDTGIDLYSNEVNPTAAVVHCTSAMAKVCGDTLTNGSVQFAPSGRYLFINDVSIRSVVVVGIDLKQHLLAETGGSLPGNPQSISFSADGGLLYAVKERNIFIYVFNAVTGLITSSRSVGFPMSVSGILPGSRP